MSQLDLNLWKFVFPEWLPTINDDAECDDVENDRD